MAAVEPVLDAERSGQQPAVVGPGIAQGGQPGVFQENDAVPVGDFPGGPIIDQPGGIGHPDGRQNPIEDLPVAAPRVGFQHRVDIIQSADFRKVGGKIVLQPIIAVDPDQGVEDSFLSGGGVVGGQGPAHLSVSPGVEAGGAVLLPVGEGRAPGVDAIDDFVQAGRGLLHQGVVVEDVAEPQQSIEPIGRLFQRPA